MKYIVFFVLLGMIWMIYKKIADSYSFVCPKCGHRFQASPGALIFTMHWSNKHFLRCPKCSKKAFMQQTMK